MVDKEKFNSDDYRTPKWLYDVLNTTYHFDLDAACTRASCLAPNGFFFDEGLDALKSGTPSWADYNRIFVNPPYSKKAGPLEEWVRIMWWTAMFYHKLVVAVLPATPNTQWFHNYVRPSGHVFYPRGRIAFDTPDGQPTKSARHDTMIVVWSGYEREINARLQKRRR